MMTLYRDCSRGTSTSGWMKTRVVLACASVSISNTLYPSNARPADRLMAVVLLATPPFWLAIDMIMSFQCA